MKKILSLLLSAAMCCTAEMFPMHAAAAEPVTDAALIEQSVRNYAKQKNIPIHLIMIDTEPPKVEVYTALPDATVLREYRKAQNFSDDILTITGYEMGWMWKWDEGRAMGKWNQPTVLDAQYILQAVTEILTENREPMQGLEKRVADVNLDGSVDAADAQLVLLYYVQNTVAQNPTIWEELLKQTSAG